jgi:Flp pilus assembly protein TadG
MASPLRLLRALLRDGRGGAIIEFAVLAPTLFTILLGAVDVGRMFYVRQSLEYATEQAARYYMMNSTSSTSTVTTFLQCVMGGNNSTSCTTPGGMGPSVRVAYADTNPCNGNASVTCTTITATYTFNFIAQYLGLGSKTLRASAQAIRY